MASCGWAARARLLPALFAAQALIAVLTFFNYYGVYEYEHVPRHMVEKELLRAVNPLLKVDPSLPPCPYDFLHSESTHFGSGGAVAAAPLAAARGFSPAGIAAGAFAPAHCRPAFSVAVLVTYRNRQSQLDIFLPYMHNFLRKQNIHYKIYLIEQQDEKPWNKGLLYNVGARAAIADKFPCLILQDVDVLPLDAANVHACLRRPRHMSAAIDKFRYVLPYEQLSGGAAALPAEQFVRVDGFSNRFTGWGGEDDDFARRLQEHDLPILRLPREMSRYTMLVHRPEAKNPLRGATLARPRARDGYASASYRTLSRRDHRLFTLIAVTL